MPLRLPHLPRLRRRDLDWRNWSIRRQINLAMGCVSLLVLMIAVVASALAFKVGAIFSEYRIAAQQSLANTEIAEDLSDARRFVFQYRLTGDESFKSALFEEMEEIHRKSLAYQETYADRPDLVERLADVDSQIDDLRASFDAAAFLQENLVAQHTDFTDRVVAARTALSELAANARAAHDLKSFRDATEVMVDLLQGQASFEAYRLDSEPQTFAAAAGSLDLALEGVGPIRERISHPERKRLAETAHQAIFKTRTLADRFRQTIEQRAGFYGEMDALAPGIEQTLQGFLDDTIARQNALGPAGEKAIRNVAWTVLGLGLVALVSAIILSWRIGRVLSRNLRFSISTMSELAQGNLDVEIRGQDRDNEMGEMSRALSVFRENASEARRLEAEKRASEERELARQSEAAEREREAAEAATQRAKEERRQFEALRAFGASVEAAIERAAEGDFSARIHTGTDNANFGRMAESINRMMQNVEAGISETARILREIAAGDLTGRMSGRFEGAFSGLQSDVNKTLETLNAMIGGMAEHGHSVDRKSAELQSAALEMSRRSEENAASLEETSSALEEMSAGVKQVAGTVSQANIEAQSASDHARKGAAVSREAVQALSEITEASRKMDSIAGLIEDIAFQINLLALNAGVESARAGEAGRGFAVVASEVRSLAQRSTEAVAEITDVISAAREKVEIGAASVGKTRETLDRIVESVGRVSEQMGSVAVSMDAQATGIAEINSAVATLDSSTQANASAAEEVTAASGILKEDAKDLSNSLKTFHIERKPASVRTPRLSLSA